MLEWMLPRRRKVERTDKTLAGANGGVVRGATVYAPDEPPPPAAPDRQVAIERMLGLRPGELDEKICAQRRAEQRAAMSKSLDEVFGKVKT